MDPRSLADRLDIHLIDVREPFEWQAGHIAAAQHIPVGEITERLDDLPSDRKLVAVCRSGSRSGEVARFLGNKGFDIDNLDGGIKAWAEAGLPITGPDGEPGKVV